MGQVIVKCHVHFGPRVRSVSAFANAMTRLLQDEALWHRLARQGRDHIAAVHGREAVRTRFMQIIAKVLAKEVVPQLIVVANTTA